LLEKKLTRIGLYYNEETAAEDIVKRYGLDTPEGHQAILEPQYKEKQALEARLDSLFRSPHLLDERIKRAITNWRNRSS
jgi:hypothetical protein